MSKEYNINQWKNQKIGIAKTLEHLFFWEGAEIKAGEFTLFYREEGHPLDDDWGYQIVSNKEDIYFNFGPNLGHALNHLAKLMGEEIEDDIPF